MNAHTRSSSPAVEAIGPKCSKRPALRSSSSSWRTNCLCNTLLSGCIGRGECRSIPDVNRAKVEMPGEKQAPSDSLKRRIWISATARAVGASQRQPPGKELTSACRYRSNRRLVFPAPVGPNSKVTSGGTAYPKGKNAILGPHGTTCQGVRKLAESPDILKAMYRPGHRIIGLVNRFGLGHSYRI
jgi:hypothetical protein